MKNILLALTFAFAQQAVADILPTDGETVIVSELQCSTAINPNGTHDIIRSAKGRADGVVDRCADETCEHFRKISLRRSEGGIDVVCGDCEKPTIFGRILLDSKLDASFNGPAKYARLNEDGTIKKEHALNCRFEIVTKSEATPGATPVQVAGGPTIAVKPATLPSVKGERADSFLDKPFWGEKPKPAPSKPRAKPKPKPKPSVKPSAPSKPSTGNAGGARMRVCPDEGGVRVRTATLNDIAFEVGKGDPAMLVKGSGRKTKSIGGKSYDFVEAQFPESKNRRGWIAEHLLKTKCDGSGKPPVTPKPNPEPPVDEPDVEPQAPMPAGGALSMAELLKPNCARGKILVSAKKVAAGKPWYNGGGKGRCALGVRQSLQASKVGGIQGGLGHAVDFVNSLKRYGYVETGIRDPKKAPPGAIIVLGGQNTAQYFKTGRMSRPYGNWVGHVTIKGDDGYYYTDGRTAEVAMGWSGDKNKRKIRNIIGIFVPGSDLVLKHRGTCKAMN